MPDGILFATSSDALDPAILPDLAVVANSLLRYPNTTARVVGHTDSTGSLAYNQSLSERRAASVAAVLRQNGVPSSRIVTIGRGPNEPIASNATPEGRAQNRRVEILIIPNQ
ncbi:MAG: OmpA family protein [Rhodobacteraceae bacterium]|nr:OmpA family protein [Paracoccaceae bacterium]